MGEKEESLGSEIAEGLGQLCDAIEAGDQIERKFTVNKVTLELEPEEYGPEEVKAIRADLNVSQAVFAQILAASVQCVQSWEQGVSAPPRMACRLLDLVKRNRDHWVRVLNESSAETSTA